MDALKSVDALYHAHADRLRRQAFRLTGDRDVADDVVHEAFVRMEAKQYHLRDIPIRAVLHTIVASISHDWIKNIRQSHVPYEGDIQESPWMNPEICCIAKEETELLLTALNQLTPESRHAFVACCIHDVSHAEIAKELGTTEGASKMLVYRARQTLRTLLAGHQETLCLT